jgi:hypothetical protein
MHHKWEQDGSEQSRYCRDGLLSSEKRISIVQRILEIGEHGSVEGQDCEIDASD